MKRLTLILALLCAAVAIVAPAAQASSKMVTMMQDDALLYRRTLRPAPPPWTSSRRWARTWSRCRSTGATWRRPVAGSRAASPRPTRRATTGARTTRSSPGSSRAACGRSSRSATPRRTGRPRRSRGARASTSRAPRSSSSSWRPSARATPAATGACPASTSGRSGTSRTSTAGSRHSVRKGVPTSPSIYRNLYLAAHGGLAATGHGGDTILLGELMPRARARATRSPPVEFLREMACLDSSYRQYTGKAAKRRGCKKVARIPTSGIAYHPYNRFRGIEQPAPAGRRDDHDAEPHHQGRRQARQQGQAAAAAAALDHRVRLPDQPARSHPGPDQAGAGLHGPERVDRLPQRAACAATRSTR